MTVLMQQLLVTEVVDVHQNRGSGIVALLVLNKFHKILALVNAFRFDDYVIVEEKKE